MFRDLLALLGSTAAEFRFKRGYLTMKTNHAER